MIEGFNSTEVEYQSIEDYEAGGSRLEGLSKIGDVLNNLETRRENVMKGGTNCIPFPFPRFRSEIPGIEQGTYTIVTASMKTGKTQIADYIYLFNALDYAFNNPGKCSVHIIYFALEESIQKIIERYMSHLLYKLDGIRIAPADLRSTSTENPVDKKILNLFETPKYKKRLEFFEQCVEFNTEDTNPTGILRACEAYAKSVGTYKSHKHKNLVTGREVEVFDSYTQDDPNHFKIVILDHIGLVDKEQGFKTKDAIDKTSEYFVKYLRNRYNFACVVIQQQASDSEGLEAIKAKRMVPTTATLGDSKYTARDGDLVLGLFDPSKFGLKDYMGYIIQDEQGYGLRTNARFLNVIANRNGEMGGICPLFFDGAVCNFEELPRSGDAEIEKFYEKTKQLRIQKQQRKSLITTALQLLTLFIFKHA